MRKLTWLASLAVGLWLGVPRAGATPPAMPDPARRAAEQFEQARPHLEAVLRNRVAAPRFVADLGRQTPDLEAQLQLRWQFADLDAETLAGAVDAFHGLSPRSARGNQGTVAVFALPSQLEILCEAVRALLDQRYGLSERWSQCRDEEEFQALQAVVEGRCLWVTWQVACRLGKETQDQFPHLIERWRKLPSPGPNPLHNVVIQKAFDRRHWSAAVGLKFFDALAQQARGKDVEGLVFSRPPRHVQRVQRPELYWRALQDNRPELSETLARLEQALASDQWGAVQQPWSPRMVLQVAELLGARDRSEKVLKNWEEGRSLVWMHKSNPLRQVAVGVMRFADPATARSYHGLAIDLQRKQDELIAARCAGTRMVLSSRSQTVPLSGADEAVLTDKQYQVGSELLPVSTLLVRSGSQVIEFSWHGLGGDVAWAERIFAELRK
jgi:hypothetical protein